MNQQPSIIVAIIVMTIVMFLPSAFTRREVGSSWYRCVRPAFTPPSFVFPIVWTFLYIMIGIGLAKTLMLRESYERNILLGLYVWNLCLNVAWSLIYFGGHDTVLALFVLLNLIVSTLFILYYSYRLLPMWVFWMLLPYVGWLYFAAVLNFYSTLKKCS